MLVLPIITTKYKVKLIITKQSIMKSKFLVLIAVLGICGLTARSQTLSPTVISSSGGFYNNSSGMLSTTVAEMTMVQTFQSGSNFLTQGFQQPEDYTVGIVETPVVSGDILIYPNPTIGSFVLSFTGNDNTETSIRLFNLAGQVVLVKQVTQSAGLNTINFDISAFSQGMYILELATTNSKGEKNSNYHKINLVY
jgi:hypothetical protein